MQTIKTGAIIVLLMTIVFSAYTSLTSPPDSLPDEVVDALIFNDDGSFAIDDGMPPSLANMDFGESPSEQPGNASAASAFSDPSSNGTAGFQGMPFPGSPAALAGTNSPVADPSAGPSFAMPNDFDASQDSFANDQTGGVSVGFSDNQPASPAANQSASFADPSVPTSYPATSNQFSMPDPATVAFGGQQTVQPASGEMDPSRQFGNSTPVRNASVRTNPTPDVGLANAIATADRQFGEGRLRDALATLSLFYTTPGIGAAQRSEMLSRLDYLAGNVIYSPRHLLETPHRVGDGETLLSIAADYQVPWQLLASINQIRNPNAIAPGSELKVMRGPMRADVDLSENELTLFLGELYAGRFSVLAGSNPAPVPGSYTVANKLPGKPYTDRSGATAAVGSPSNPYGDVYIDLGRGISMHSSSNAAAADPNRPGACLTLTPKDAVDLMGILSIGSQIELR